MPLHCGVIYKAAELGSKQWEELIVLGELTKPGEEAGVQ